MTFTPIGDKELWVFKSEVADIPLICIPVTDSDGYPFWMITRAVYIHFGLQMILSNLLAPLSIVRERDRWIIPKDKLPESITKCPGITPEYYLRMDEEVREEKPIESEVPPEPPSHNDEFIRETWNRSRIGELGVFKVVWASLIDGLAHRLLIDQKSVDLGWFSLHALPFRLNWKQNLLSKHPKLKVLFTSLTARQREVALKMYGVEADVFRTDNMAVVKNGDNHTFRWTLEIETKEEWWEYMDQLERQRLTSSTSEAYLNRWATIVRRSKRIIHALLRQFTDQMARPAGQPLAHGDGRRRRLAPYVPDGKGRPANLDRMDCPLVVDDRTDTLQPPESPQVANPKASKMPPLPVLRLGIQNVRPSGGNVGGPDGE